MLTEKFNQKETPLRTFADETTTFYLLLLTCSLPMLISSILNTDLGQAALAVGGVTTAASFATGRIINRNSSEGDHPKPLAAENKPITIVSFKPSNATN